jgi:tetratricopeptide (TPR) repeat protein
LRDYAGAIEDYNEAIRLDPKYVAAYNNRGIAKSKLQDFVGAIKDYDEAIRLDPKNVNAHLVRGMAKDDMRDYAGAIKDYDEAIRIDPKRPSAKNNKAFLLSTAEDARVRNPDLALKLAEEVLSVDPSNAEATNAKSCALAAKGDYTSAIALQESITDTAWLKNDSVVGGVHAKARITAWKSGKLWHASEGIARESLATITNVSNTSSCSIFQECQADAHGNVHLAWVDGSSDLGILYSRWDGMTWSPPTNVLNRSVVSVAPSMAIAPSGKVHLVCMMGGQFDCDIYYSELLDDTWSKPINISNLKGISQCPKIALDSAGILHVAWFDNTNGHLELFHCRREAETWLPPVNTNLVLGQLADDTEMLISPGLAADHQGQLHLVWGDRIVESATPENDLFYSCWRDGVWSKPEQISQKQGQPTRPAICTDAAGNLHVTWQDYFSESWYCSKLGEKWSEPLNFCPEMQDAGLPAICPGPNGEIHLAWTGGEEETPQIFYRRFQEGSWSETVRVTNNPFGAVFPKIAFDAKGKLHLTWMDWSRSNSEIFHCRGIPADQPRVRRPRSDEAETLRPFVRGDFQEIISYPNRADLPESVVISQPRGEFVKIDVTASNEILRSLLNTDPTAQQQALKEVLAAPNAYAPPALYATANAMFQLGKEDEALFWYYLGLLRATSDAYKYKSPDGSVQDAVYLLNKKFGPPFQEMFRTDWQKTIAIVEKVIAWDRQNARAYNPKWIALAGTDAFSKFFVPFASDDIWLRIDRETRQEFFGEFQDMLRAAEISDKNRDQRLNEDEKDAFDDTLTQLLQVNSRGVLKHNLKDYEGAIKDFDEVVRIDSKNVRAYYNRGHAKSDLNDYAGAIVDFDEVLGLNPRNLEAKSSKAFLLSIAEDEAIRNPVDALRLAEEVLREYYGNGFAMNAKSCALAAKGDFKAAIALQESIADSDWINDEGIDGGAHAKARIAAWKSGQLWHP